MKMKTKPCPSCSDTMEQMTPLEPDTFQKDKWRCRSCGHLEDMAAHETSNPANVR